MKKIFNYVIRNIYYSVMLILSLLNMRKLMNIVRLSYSAKFLLY